MLLDEVCGLPQGLLVCGSEHRSSEVEVDAPAAAWAEDYARGTPGRRVALRTAEKPSTIQLRKEFADALRMMNSTSLSLHQDSGKVVSHPHFTRLVSEVRGRASMRIYSAKTPDPASCGLHFASCRQSHAHDIYTYQTHDSSTLKIVQRLQVELGPEFCTPTAADVAAAATRGGTDSTRQGATHRATAADQGRRGRTMRFPGQAGVGMQGDVCTPGGD